jgi:hypothetical protein
MLATAFSAVALAQAPKAAAPSSVVISSYRIFPKPGHGDDLRAGLGAHIQKFHTGTSSQRVYAVISGPDSGSYHIVTGPNTWTAIDDFKSLGEEHNKDYAAKVTAHTERRGPTTYGSFSKELSTVAATKFSDKAMVRRYTVKPGMLSTASDYFKAYKKVWEKLGYTVAVWQSFGSGEPTYSVVFRLKNGFKDFDVETPSSRKIMEEITGPNEYARVQGLAASAFSQVISEMIVFRPELSSK